MKNILKILFLLLFIGVSSYMGYLVISKINHKKEVSSFIKTMPKFSYQNLDGSVFTNANLKINTPTIFVYFNSDCEFCNGEASMIKENVDQFSNIQLVFISFEKPVAIKTFAQKNKLDGYDNIHFVCDSKVSFSTTFDVKSMPCLVMYNKNNQLIEKIKGQTKVESLLKKITK
jgi:peroxiredoxin